MSKKSIRVYKLARELDVSSKEVLDLIQNELNLEVTNHMSTVNNQVADRIRRHFRGEAEPEEQAPEAEPAEEQPAEKKARKPEAAKNGAASTNGRVKRQPATQESEAAGRSKSSSASGAQPVSRSATQTATQERTAKVLEVELPITVGELADAIGVRATDAIKRLMNQGIMANINANLEEDVASLLAGEYGYELEAVEPEKEDFREEIDLGDPEKRQPRWPVVTVLGHVDHGKTTLLDKIRETNVVRGEAGGITQHIGASTVEQDGKRVVFLDTPGHEAFTAMRARGAQVTDIAILVVAADDGIMPQTVEAINHAQAAGVPVIVAINKIDKPEAEPEQIKQQLTEHGLVPEEWGGETIVVEVSALNGDGIDELLEMISLLAEVEELGADPDRPAMGTVLEAQVDKGRGPVATVLIQSGTLHRGDAFVVGLYDGKVRAMTDDRGERVKEAGPSTAVEIMGLSDVPQAGDVLKVVEDDKQARSIAAERQEQARQDELAERDKVSLDSFSGNDGERKVLRLVLKADVHGSLEALQGSLEKLANEEVGLEVIHRGVGAINESDVMLADASDAVIIGFNVRPDANARREAERTQIDIRTYRVIYEAIEDVQAAIVGMFEPEIREVVLGRAEIRQLFRVPGAGTVAGLYVQDGKMTRNGQARVVREGRVIYEGEIESLKRFENDVREVQAGYECGLSIAGYNDLKERDVIECVTEEEVPRT